MPKTTGRTNQTFPVGFILLGISEWPQLERTLFWVVIFLFTMSILGNSSIILLSCVDPRLHTPMYFFLSNLSFLDLCLTSASVPQMLVHLWGSDKSITHTGCVIQLCVFLCVGATEGVLLVQMAIDRYVAVCQPLRYTALMHRPLCWKLVFLAWLSGLIVSLVESSTIFQLPFCPHHLLNGFLCEVPVLLRLACGDTSVNEWQMTITTVIFTMVPVGLILASYGCIAQAVRNMKSEEGRKKVTATCSSHLLVVFMFYGTVAMVYTDPKSNFASKNGKFFTFFYTVVTPLLNPLVYTLRNKEVKDAWLRLMRKWVSLWKSK
ncbi:Olfactory receptor 2H1 [Sciurus carolinensis]|uniref:Olfactory receptor n=2 Tax=Sciurus carolinensis TaxID=30640 RepID=A0AA41NII1_SCICA|nr:Olfactory receptor 2H1 [Sciurus carolinensis]